MGPVQECIREAAAAFGVSPKDVMSRKRTKAVCYARACACALLNTRFSWSTVEIGKALGRDHTTIISNLRAARRDPVALAVVNIIRGLERPERRRWVAAKCSPCGVFDALNSCAR